MVWWIDYNLNDNCIIKKSKDGIITYEEGAIVAGNGIDKYIEIEAGINKLPIKEVFDFPEYVTFDVNKCLLTGHDEHMARVERNCAKRFGTVLNIYRSEPFFLEITPYWDVLYARSRLRVFAKRFRGNEPNLPQILQQAPYQMEA